MPITREQIESIDTIILLERGPGASSAASPMSFGDVEQVKRLALVGLDHAADARLGARVRIAINNAANDDGDTPLGTSERLLAEFTDEDQDADAWAVFQAIAESLKEEQADAVRGEGR